MKTTNYKRSGDHYLHEVNSLPKGLKKIEHKGKFVFGVGEASNHNHTITAPRVEDFNIYQDETGRYYFEILSPDVKISHFLGDSSKVAEHETIPAKKTIYKQVHERELDWSSAVARKVQD
jgi:hypothetical protein